MTIVKRLPLTNTTIASDAAPDPFDLDSLCLRQDFNETIGVKKLLTTIPARRPNPQDFIRVHSSPDYRRNLLCVDLKEDRECYVVRPEIALQLAGETVMKTLFTGITRQASFSCGQLPFRRLMARQMNGGAPRERRPSWPPTAGFR